jgi:hypothetical protein
VARAAAESRASHDIHAAPQAVTTAATAKAALEPNHCQIAPNMTAPGNTSKPLAR